jgi:hypothetical protein
VDSLRLQCLEPDFPVDVFTQETWWEGVLQVREVSDDALAAAAEADSDFDEADSCVDDPARFFVFCPASRDSVQLDPQEPGRRGKACATACVEGSLRAGLAWRNGRWFLRGSANKVPFDAVQLARGGAAALKRPGGRAHGSAAAGAKRRAPSPAVRAAAFRAHKRQQAHDLVSSDDTGDDEQRRVEVAPAATYKSNVNMKAQPAAGGTPAKKAAAGGAAAKPRPRAALAPAPPRAPAVKVSTRLLASPGALALIFLTRKRIMALVEAPGSTPDSVRAALPGCIVRTYDHAVGGGGCTSRLWVVRDAYMRRAYHTAADALDAIELFEHHTSADAESKPVFCKMLSDVAPSGEMCGAFLGTPAAKLMQLAACRAIALRLAVAEGVPLAEEMVDNAMRSYTPEAHDAAVERYSVDPMKPAWTLVDPYKRSVGGAIGKLATVATDPVAQARLQAASPPPPEAAAAPEGGAGGGAGGGAAAGGAQETPARCTFHRCRRVPAALAMPHYCYNPPPPAPEQVAGPFCVLCLASWAKHMPAGFAMWRADQGPPATTPYTAVLEQARACASPNKAGGRAERN